MTDTAKIIRDVRTKLGLSQKRLGDMAGVSQSTIARLETPGYTCSVDTLLMIAAAVDHRVRIEFEPAAPPLSKFPGKE